MYIIHNQEVDGKYLVGHLVKPNQKSRFSRGVSKLSMKLFIYISKSYLISLHFNEHLVQFLLPLPRYTSGRQHLQRDKNSKLSLSHY